MAFKSDNQKQSMLLSPNLDELRPATHRLRVMNAIIDCLDVNVFFKPITVAVPSFAP